MWKFVGITDWNYTKIEVFFIFAYFPEQLSAPEYLTTWKPLPIFPQTGNIAYGLKSYSGNELSYGLSSP